MAGTVPHGPPVGKQNCVSVPKTAPYAGSHPRYTPVMASGDHGVEIDYERPNDHYLSDRTLQRTAGPWLLWGLGVGYVISGDFFGWNFGLAAGGFWGMAVAVAVMATLYLCLIVSLAEMATAMPVAGGPYAFARRALGPLGGYITGLAVTIEYVVAPAVIATGIAGYVAGMFQAPPPWLAPTLPVACYALFVGLNLLGSQVSLRTLLGVTGVSVAVLLVWAAAMAPHVKLSNLEGSIPAPSAAVAALPAAGWFFLAIEGVPLAAEEARDPARDLPRGMIAAMVSLLVFAGLALIIGVGVTGSDALSSSDNPLPTAVERAVGRTWVYWSTTVVGLAGLVASFFSIVFAYSRQIFALSRAGYLPRWLSRTNRFHAPHWALIVPAGLGYLLIRAVDEANTSDVAAGDLLIQMAVFAALVSYVMMMVSHLVLRRREPDLARPYRTPLHPVPPIVALVLSGVALTSTLFYADGPVFAVAGTAIAIGLGVAYFWAHSRHHLVASAPEEEFAVVRAAQAELDHPGGPD